MISTLEISDKAKNDIKRKSAAMKFINKILGKETCISRAQLCDIEKGRRFVSLERAVHFADKLGQPRELFVNLAIKDMATKAGINIDFEIKKVA